MEFTYRGYENMLNKLTASGYEFSGYDNWKDKNRPVILRHDIDYDVDKALKLAELEADAGAFSTYFVLLSSDLYNVFSDSCSRVLRSIRECGHHIGLHFDEKKHAGAKIGELAGLIRQEAEILQSVTGAPADTVSMHRPRKELLDADLEIPGMINSYSSVFFSQFKYISDSRRRWREPVDEIIEEATEDRLHILTHAFWYNDEEMSLEESVKKFVRDGNRSRYFNLMGNITDLGAIMKEDEIV